MVMPTDTPKKQRKLILHPPFFQRSLTDTLEFYRDILSDAAKGDVADLFTAWIAEQDRFFLLTEVLNRGDLIHPWVFERCREVQAEPDGYLDLWAREHYKALDCETPVLTQNGWKRHIDLKVGDKVYSPSGGLVNVMANTGIMYNADCYDVEGVVAAGNHLWPVALKHRYRCDGGRYVSYSSVKVATRDLNDSRLSNIKPICGTVTEFSVPPYVLGAWLGDGHTAGGRITSGDEEFWDIVEWATKRSSTKYTRNLPDLMPLLRRIGVLNNKHVPTDYLYASISQRLALLQGLMDTDGSVNSRGTATFCNSNENLVDAVRFLACSLGMRASKRRYENAFKGYWQVSFQAYRGELCPFRLSRKIARCKVGEANMRMVTAKPVETRPVNCIQVEGGLYLAGYNLLPTHNSTIITFGGSMEAIIKDPNVTIGIFSHTRPIAKQFLRQIMHEMEANAKLPRLWPNIFWEAPRRQAPKWSEDDGIIVKRTTNPKEATVEAYGLTDGQPTSKHFMIRNYDDVVTLESVNTPEQIEKTTTSWQMSGNLGARGGVERYCGTRYHLFDTYHKMMEVQAVKVRIHPATHNGKEDGEPVLLTKKELDDKRRKQGMYIFASQQLLNPASDKVMGFDLNWIQYAVIDRSSAQSRLNIYIIVDPASAKKAKARKDPDFTSMWVIGASAAQQFYVLDAIRDRINLTQKADKLIGLHRKWRPLKVGYEEIGMQADIEHIQYRMREELYEFEITPLGGNLAKNDRIRGLIPVFEDKRIFLPNGIVYKDYTGGVIDVIKVFIEEEYTSFPVCAHDDQFDGMARINDPVLGIIFPDPDIPVNAQGFDYHSIEEQIAEGDWTTS